MKYAKRLVYDTILYGLAQFSSSLLSLFMLPIITRYFTPAEFGTWDIALTAVTLLIPLVSFELTAATYRWLLDETELVARIHVITTGFFQLGKQLMIGNIFLSIIFLMFSFPYQWALLCLLNTNIISSFFIQCVRGLRKNSLFATLSILQSLVVFGMLLIFMFVFFLRVEAFFYAHIIANIVVIIVALVLARLAKYIRWRAFSRKLVNEYFAYALPIIPAAISWWFMTMADRWFIVYFLDVSANGIYAIALKVAAVLMMLSHIFSLAWKDNVITTFRERDRKPYYDRVYIMYVRILALAVLMLSLLAKPLIHFFIGAAYAEAWRYSGILLLATLFHALALFWSSSFHAAKQTNAIFFSTLVGAGINIILNLFLTPIFGLYGVAVATFIAFFITWVLRVYLAKPFFKVNLRVGELSVWMMLIFGGIGLTLFL